MKQFTCAHCGTAAKSYKPTARFCSRPCADDGRKVHFNAALALLPTQACVEWTGHIQNIGYGRGVGRDGKTLLAHRAVWEHFNGPVPDGLELDHLCRNRRCVNPAHLEPVTHTENVARSVRPVIEQCKRGHEFTPENTYRNSGRRHCKMCRQARQVQRRHHLRVVVER